MNRALLHRFVLVSAVLLVSSSASARSKPNVLSHSSANDAGWRLTSPALYGVTVTAIAVDPRSSQTIYAAGHTGRPPRQSIAVFRSDDGGFTWRPIQNGLSGLSVTGLLLNPINPDVVYLGVFGRGVFKSLDRGESWTMLSVGISPWVNSIAMDDANPETLYVAIGGDGIYRTTDGGATWTLISAALGDPGLLGVSVIDEPTSSSRIYTTTAGLDLYRSEDAGGTWQRVSAGIQRLLWIDSTTRVLYALGEDGRLLRSLDAGITWTAIGAGLPTNVFLGPLRSDPANPSILYIGTTGLGVFRSRDGGLTWNPFNEGIAGRSITALLIPPGGDPLLYAGTDAGLFDYRARSAFRITLPAVASLHGVPPAFFHSDVWVFNGSADSDATVTATYRCLSGSPCSGLPQTFTVPSRQVKTFRDIAVSLFHAPESAGAVEFESDRRLVVTSRLYTPDASQPTKGMFVRGQPDTEAQIKQVLLSLSHSADLARGFRTNIGFYNPTDTASFVQLDFFEASGAGLGQIILFAAPRHPIQLNDNEIFQRLGIGRDVPSFYCTVLAYPREDTTLFAYAAVIDNRSGDPFFVTGEAAAGSAESKITIPAAASLHGAGGTFFHSDVRIWNPSTTETAAATVRYACSGGGCTFEDRPLTVAPGQMLGIDDFVSAFFHAPETGGALEFVSAAPLVVASRLYAGAAPEPTLGMFVPGLVPRRASPAVALVGLSHASDFATGSRVNIGVFNQADVAQVVTYRLFDGSGNQIGQASRFFGPREWFQVNDVFAFMNVTASLESAYCLVEGSELLPIFAYAAVIDNRSQDPIFVSGEGDPERPPIVPLGEGNLSR